MVNLLSELEGLCTQIPISLDQRCAGAQGEKIHVINVTPTWSLKRVGTARTNTRSERLKSTTAALSPSCTDDRIKSSSAGTDLTTVCVYSI